MRNESPFTRYAVRVLILMGVLSLTGSVRAGITINEILADPASGLAGDANGDGSRHSSQDEFVELVNDATDASVDLSGWTLSDELRVRHTFTAGTVLGPHAALVVFGGGTPTGPFGGALVALASTGSLGLNNGGDVVTLRNATDDVVATVSYGAEGGDNQSLTRSPDLIGLAFVRHGAAAGSGGAVFSPGTTVSGDGFTTGGPAVPAPGALGLALIGLLGLRRSGRRLRRR